VTLTIPMKLRAAICGEVALTVPLTAAAAQVTTSQYDNMRSGKL